MNQLPRLALVLTALLCAGATARAQTVEAGAPAVAPSSSSSVADPEVLVASRFERTLSYYGDSERRMRWISSGFLVGLGATLTGLSLLTLRDSPEPTVQYVLLGFGAASVAGAVIPLLRRDPMERLREAYLAGLRGGATPGEAMHRTEVLWQQMADTERRARRFTGWLAIAGGVGTAAAAPVLAVVQPSTRPARQTNLISLGVTGVVAVGLGVALLTIPGSLEESLRVWQIGQGRSTTAGLRLGMPSVAVNDQGASLLFQGSF
jgi:hypothetical protein